MEPGSAISKEEESRRIFWVIQTIFGFIIGTSFFSYASIYIPPYGNDILTVTIALFSVYLCVLWSWVDFSFTLIIRPYNFRRNKLEVLRFFFDLLIVLSYTYILAYIDYINSAPFDKNIFHFFIAFTVTFSLYCLSGILRRKQYGKKASNLKLIVMYDSTPKRSSSPIL